MSDAEWDAEDFEPQKVVKPVIISDKWEGEDEDESVRDNWDDDDDENEEKKEEKTDALAMQTKKKKSLKERLAEKEEKKRKELEEKLEKKKQEEELKKAMTPKQLVEEKLRKQKLQEKADLELALEAFGLGKKDENKGGEIDNFDPSSKDDFDKFEELLKNKLTKYEKSPLYVPFLENLFRDLALGVETDDIKKLSSTLTALSNEKLKQQKKTGKTKKSKKATINVGKDTENINEEEAGYDEYEDYL